MTHATSRGRRAAPTARRHGFTLPELMVALVITAILGTAAVRMFVSQSHFFDKHVKQQSARAVSRAAVNAVLSDLRMVDAPNGVVAATTSSITVRAPYAMGVVCASSGSYTTVAFLPMDSLTFASAALSGYGWRESSGNYSLQEAGVSVTAGTVATCTGAGITPVSGGKVLRVAPAFPAAAVAGSPAYLFQRVTYAFAPSTAITGRTALWRTLVASGAAEEVAAPFDSTSGFAFYDLSSNPASTTVPALPSIRGIELVLNGESETPRSGRTTPEMSSYTTAVFFMNGNR